MKSFLTIFAVMCIVVNTSAQDESTKTPERKFELGARAGTYSTSYIQGLRNFYAYFTIRKGIHEFAIGPTVGSSPGFYFYSGHDSPFRLTGVDLTYRISPNGPGKIFDFYFQANYFQKWTSGTGISPVFTVYPPSPLEEVKVNSSASQLLLEYGFDVKFLKHFYIGIGFGMGVKYVSYKYDYSIHTELNQKTNEVDLDVLARANIGFRF